MHIEFLPLTLEFNMYEENNHVRVYAVVVLFFLVSMMVSAICFAEALPMTAPITKQNLGLVKTKITEFLETQAIGYPGKVSVHAGAIDPNLKLVQCPDVQVFLPTGSRAWGKTSVGVRCNAPSVWTIYVQATVNVVAQYLVAAAPLSQGQVVTAQDILFESGDLTQLPAGVFTDQEQAIGRSVNISMNAGTVLRQELLKVSPVVQQGQTVMLISKGKGFSVSAEGQAIGKANEGQVVQVKVASGQVVTGIARNGGQVEVGF
jgi:flagella basal body P-ring formation protein FlgA